MLLIFYRLNVSWRVLCFDVYYFVQEDDQIAKLFLVTGRQWRDNESYILLYLKYTSCSNSY
jgi:hypothetical protein